VDSTIVATIKQPVLPIMVRFLFCVKGCPSL
jgi:hypothetical protein